MYDTLDKLPIKIYFKILETGDIELLNQGKKSKNKIEIEKIISIWESLFEEFSEQNEDVDTKKTLRLSKDVEMNQTKFNLVETFCVALDFEWDDDLVDILRGWGYTLTEEHYYDDLDRIKRESEGLLLKAENSKKLLPKPGSDNATIDDVLASYSSVMGFDFDYESISCRKYLALKKQINIKIKQAEANLNNSKKNGK